MNETLTFSVWEDLIHNQRWEELRAKLAATHSSDIAEALGQIHGKEQAVVFRLLPATPLLRFLRISPRTGRKHYFEPFQRMK
jgi:Mg/Co/Ni transporter MgtE